MSRSPIYAGGTNLSVELLAAEDRQSNPAVEPGSQTRQSNPSSRTRHSKLILSTREQDGMRKAGRFNAQLLDEIRLLARPGVELDEVDRFVHSYTLDHGHIPACLALASPRKLSKPKSFCKYCSDAIRRQLSHVGCKDRLQR